MTKQEATDILNGLSVNCFIDMQDDWESGVNEEEFRQHYYTRPQAVEAFKVLYPRTPVPPPGERKAT